ncbi:MAG TPA: nucleotidyltransferase substrate binding protein [Lentimicrobium sp.]|nr:nucleotidyltransferase substrate binding protein [Lentimicrobium sp.]
MVEPDIRWKQRFSNFVKALDKLTQAVEYIELNLNDADDSDDNDELQDVLDEIVKEGLIQRFEYTHELAWNVMRDYAVYQGNNTIGGSRDAVREALQLHLIPDGEVWMEMIGSWNKTSHTYNEETADEIYYKIVNEYYAAMIDFRDIMESKRSGV